jgi:hypothetical protein
MKVDECRLLRSLTTLAAALSLALPSSTGVPVSPGLLACPPGSDVGIDDFVVWVDIPGGGNAEVPIRANVGCNTPRTIYFKTYDITAKAGIDYRAVNSGEVTMNSGSTFATARIQILSKSQAGPDLTFGVQLTSGAKFKDPDATVTIKFR